VWDNNVYSDQSPQFYESCAYALSSGQAASFCQSYDPFAFDLYHQCYDAGLPLTAADGSFVCAWYNYMECPE
jgi:hypothetical protein